jgi:hypothetical protein
MLRPEEYIVDFAEAVVVYPLSDVTTGTTAPAFPANSSYDGTIEAGMLLQNADIGVDCDDRLAPDFDSTSAVTLPHANLISGNAFDIQHGGVFLVAKANTAALTDNVRRRLVAFKQSAVNDLLDIHKMDDDKIRYRFNADGVLHNGGEYGIAEGVDISETFSVALTWDWTAHEVKFYINGIERETYAYNTQWNTYNGGPNPFTMSSMIIGGIYLTTPAPAGIQLEWDGNIIYHSLFAGTAPDATTIAKIHEALVG